MHLLILSIIDTALKIVLLAMQSQTEEQRAKSWQWHVEFVEFFRGLLKIPPGEIGPGAAVETLSAGNTGRPPRPVRVTSQRATRPKRYRAASG